MVFAVGVCSAHVEEDVRLKVCDGFFYGGEECGQIFFVGYAVFEIEIERGVRFVGRVIVELMDGESEDGSVFVENGGGAVAMVDVGVDDDGAGNFFAGLQSADGYGYVVDGAEAFAVAGVGVVEAAANVAAEAVLEGGFGGGDGAAGGEPEGANEFGGIGTSSFICSLAVRVPVFSFWTQSSVWTRRMSVSVAGSGRRKSPGVAMPSLRSLSWIKRNFSEGKTWAPRLRS